MNRENEIERLKEKLSALPKEIEPEAELKAKMWQNILDAADRVNPSSNGHSKEVQWNPSRRINLKYVLAGITALILLAITSLLLYNRYKTQEPSIFTMSIPTYWKVNKTSGSPSLKNEDKNVLRSINEIDSFTTGEWVLTDNSSSAEIQAAGVGSIKLEPGTKVKFINSGDGGNKIMLQSGTIEAVIYAKPRTFSVETRSATAIDLGCSYTLTVSDNGDGVLYVKQGLVALEAHGRESLVPAGKFCISKEGFGPGTPYSPGTSSNLKNALMKFDFKNGGDKSVRIILKNAKKNDAVTLLNLLQRVDEASKSPVYDRLTEFVPPPKPYPPDSIPMFNPDELTKWIEKMQTEIHENIQKNMENLHEQLHDMQLNLNMQFDGKDYKYKWRHKEDYDSAEVFENMDSLGFNKEEFQKDLNEEMENLKAELEQVNKELELNREEIKQEMERVKEEMKKIKIDIKIDMKDLKDKINKDIDEEMDKEKEKKEEKEKTDQ